MWIYSKYIFSMLNGNFYLLTLNNHRQFTFLTKCYAIIDHRSLIKRKMYQNSEPIRYQFSFIVFSTTCHSAFFNYRFISSCNILIHQIPESNFPLWEGDFKKHYFPYRSANTLRYLAKHLWYGKFLNRSTIIATLTISYDVLWLIKGIIVR